MTDYILLLDPLIVLFYVNSLVPAEDWEMVVSYLTVARVMISHHRLFRAPINNGIVIKNFGYHLWVN